MEIPYELLIKYCRKQTSEAEMEQVEKWLDYDKNSLLFTEFRQEWVYINDNSIIIPDKAIIWQKIQSKIANEKKYINIRKSRHFGVIASIAAVIAILIVSSVVYFFINRASLPEPEQFTTLQTTSSEKLQTELSDGTLLWINSETSVIFSNKYDIEKREISLDGEIFIDIKPSDKPFIISTDIIKVEVMGTSFNIRAYKNEDDIKIELIRGKIRITNTENNKKILDMDAPQYVKINKKNLTCSFSNNNTSASNIWTQEYLVIDNEPLNNVMDKLENWYGIEIHYTGLDTAKNYTFQLQNEDIYEFLNLFSFITPVDYSFKDKKLYIENKKN